MAEFDWQNQQKILMSALIEAGKGKVKMKKLFTILILGLLTLALVACSQNNTEENTVSASELTDRENTILSTTSDKSFVFDINIDSEYEEVAVWIEKYESGNLVDDSLGYITTQTEQNGSIIFSLTKNNNENTNIFNVGVGADGGATSMNVSDENLNGLENMGSVWGSIPEKKALDNGEVVLASICYSDDENGMQSLTKDFYGDTASHMNELEKYNVAYLLKVEFIK